MARWKEEGPMNITARIIFVVGLVLALSTTNAGPAHAEKCMRAGGWGTGIVEGFASFMAEAAMKNQAKAWGGDAVKISKVNTKCEWKALAYECTARARACK
jgi:hypothetical protein